jgi:hypothetical protein
VILCSTFEFLFEFQNRIFLEFFAPVSSCSNIKPFEVRGSTVYRMQMFLLPKRGLASENLTISLMFCASNNSSADASGRGLAARLLELWVRILPRAWMSVSCECCVMSGRGLCDELVTRPEESYRLWCV